MFATRSSLYWPLILGFAGLGAVVSFGESASSSAGERATAAAKPAPMSGLYAGVKPPETSEQAAEFVRALEACPNLRGALLAAHWDEIEPEEGKYDFTRLDRCIDLVRKAGKQYKFKVETGIYSPPYIYKAGAVRFDTVIANPNRSNYGDPATIPVPWDPGYQRHFSRLIRTMGQRYASDPHCVAVTLTCANYQSAEMHLPKRPEDMKRWAELGLTPQRLLQVYFQYMDEWAAAFPRQLICLHMSKTTQLSGMSDDEFAERIVQYGLEKRADQFALQSNGLNGRKERMDDPGNPIMKYRSRLINGFQSFASFRTPERQGSIEMAALNYVKADAEYWELWGEDGLSSETCRKVQAAVDEAQRLGYEGYKQKLIATGRYARPEEDRWSEIIGERKKAKDAGRLDKPTSAGASVAPRKDKAPVSPGGSTPAPDARPTVEKKSATPKQEKKRPGLPNGADKMSWLEPDKTEPPGCACKTFHSKTINGEASYLIYLPPDYDKDPSKRYPVLYWLHGSGAPQSKGGTIAKYVDDAIRAGQAPPMIVVLVNGLRGATMYSDTKDGKWPLESVIINDLIPYMDRTYRTYATREMRGVEGFSMGGFGAAHFGFKYPDVFGVVSILAPALLGPEVTDEGLKRKWEDHLSFVFNGDLDAYHANNPFDLIPKNAGKIRGRSIIRMVPHGTAENWLIPRCDALYALMQKHHIACEYTPFPDINRHNYHLLYEKLGGKAVGFFAQAFAAPHETLAERLFQTTQQLWRQTPGER